MITGSEFWTTNSGQRTVERIRERVINYWKENIYQFYHRGTGQLGEACDVTIEDDTIVVYMNPIYGTDASGQVYDYGKSIRNGIPSGYGKYSPAKQIRLKYGLYPGVPKDKFWIPWMETFSPVVQAIVEEELQIGLDEYIGQLVGAE